MRLLIFLWILPLIANAETTETQPDEDREIVEALQDCQAGFHNLWNQLSVVIKSHNVLATRNTSQYATIRKLRRKVRRLKRERGK